MTLVAGDVTGLSDLHRASMLTLESMLASIFFEVLMTDESECDMIWRTARECDGGQCVEIGLLGNVVMIRDSADRDGGRIALNHQGWRKFITVMKDGI